MWQSFLLGSAPLLSFGTQGCSLVRYVLLEVALGLFSGSCCGLYGSGRKQDPGVFDYWRVHEPLLDRLHLSALSCAGFALIQFVLLGLCVWRLEPGGRRCSWSICRREGIGLDIVCLQGCWPLQCRSQVIITSLVSVSCRTPTPQHYALPYVPPLLSVMWHV